MNQRGRAYFPEDDMHIKAFIEPDSCLPSQFFKTRGVSWSPEKKLLAAVLQDAIDTYRAHIWRVRPINPHAKHTNPQTYRANQLCAEIEAWMHGAPVDGGFTFRDVCARLDLDTQAVRDVVLSRKGAHVPERRVRV